MTASTSAVVRLAALALHLADAHRAERAAQGCYTDASATVHRMASYRDSDEYAAAEDARTAAVADHRTAIEATRATLAELMAVADEWNAAAAQPVDDKRGESLDPPRPPVEPTPLRR